MDDFQRILKSLPPKPARSRLEPYGKLINELLRRGRAYREIARILAESCEVRVSISTIHDFVRLHTQPKHNSTRHQQPKAAKKSEVTTALGGADREPSSAENPRPALEDVYQRIAALKRRPAVVQKPDETFHYNPNEPLHLKRNSIPDGAKNTN